MHLLDFVSDVLEYLSDVLAWSMRVAGGASLNGIAGVIIVVVIASTMILLEGGRHPRRLFGLVQRSLIGMNSLMIGFELTFERTQRTVARRSPCAGRSQEQSHCAKNSDAFHGRHSFKTCRAFVNEVGE
jgi:hypothetical protein